VDSSVLKDEKARFHLNAAAELLMYASFLPCCSVIIIPNILFQCSYYINCVILIKGVTVRSWRMH
jgi:hypothetical protein